MWEESVRASHDFLTDNDILNLMPFVKIGLDNISTLVVAYDNQQPVGFVGVQDHIVEMLFDSPHFFGGGIGRRLIGCVINEYGVLGKTQQH